MNVMRLYNKMLNLNLTTCFFFKTSGEQYRLFKSSWFNMLLNNMKGKNSRHQILQRIIFFMMISYSIYDIGAFLSCNIHRTITDQFYKENTLILIISAKHVDKILNTCNLLILRFYLKYVFLFRFIYWYHIIQTNDQMYIK